MDADGTPLSRSRYTPFGDGRHVRVAETQVWNGTAWDTLTATLPITQTNYLYQGDYLERELGIYFTGDGRYYDPWLGKYLQPDPIGGPPLVPQAADRYQYAGNSPTGVGAGSSSAYWAFVGDVAVELGQQAASEAIKKALPSIATKRVVKWGGTHLWVRLQASRRMIRRLAPSLLDDLPVISRGKSSLTLAGRMKVSDFPLLSLDEMTQLNLTWRVKREVAEEVFESGTARIGNWLIKGLVGEVVIPFGLDAGFQYLQDWGNPYLTPEQKANRALLAGGIGFGAAGLGWLIALAGGPPAWITAIVLEVTVGPIVFSWVCEEYGWNDEMRLRPLGEGEP